MKILVACEESQAVTIELRKLGHEAYSNDLIECSGGHPEWHIQGDVVALLNGDVTFTTMDGVIHYISKWDMIIAFPPCTYLTLTGNRWFNIEKYGEKAIQRHKDREFAVNFFKAIASANCKRIAIENPIGVMNSLYRKPNQIIHPWMFGFPTTKATCLWLKGLPKLKETDVVGKGEVVISKTGNRMSKWYYETSCLPHKDRAKARSKTFPGIAKAMAEQWAGKL